MKRKRFRKSLRPITNLDSFLDVMTNLVGFLMFLSLFVSLLAVEGGTIIRTPLVSSSNKNPRFFEVRENQVSYIDYELIDYQVEKFFASLPGCEQPQRKESSFNNAYSNYYEQELELFQQCLKQKSDLIKTFRARTNYYQVSFVDNDALLYEPLETVEGESLAEVEKNYSQFNQQLNEFDPEIDYLAFVVRPDSFETFRKVRDLARRAGFDVGWEPSNSDTPIVFGAGGRTIGVQ
ncbi:MAG: hypothetical protein DSM107014_06960 [Gomphosphaeria aponina SAG 52.96 = DSM 107014]|uniref:Uncharacterized protein n=1 Tax=Gomphosphaeria aponina SAG 52.96 = DSM 107014 TaxID=1521640 RepID=A0A941JSY7_9CHRO|nr:hypothetical protein [Gomphosphaeria aponina SAG 52.96 = DSM 107014]